MSSKAHYRYKFMDYTEDTLVQQATAEPPVHQFGRASVVCEISIATAQKDLICRWSVHKRDFGPGGLLGHGTARRLYE